MLAQLHASVCFHMFARASIIHQLHAAKKGLPTRGPKWQAPLNLWKDPAQMRSSFWWLRRPPSLRLSSPYFFRREEMRKWEEKRMRREEEIQRRAEKAVKLAQEKRKQREEEKARLREDRREKKAAETVSVVQQLSCVAVPWK